MADIYFDLDADPTPAPTPAPAPAPSGEVRFDLDAGVRDPETPLRRAATSWQARRSADEETIRRMRRLVAMRPPEQLRAGAGDVTDRAQADLAVATDPEYQQLMQQLEVGGRPRRLVERGVTAGLTGPMVRGSVTREDVLNDIIDYERELAVERNKQLAFSVAAPKFDNYAQAVGRRGDTTPILDEADPRWKAALVALSTVGLAEDPMAVADFLDARGFDTKDLRASYQSKGLGALSDATIAMLGQAATSTGRLAEFLTPDALGLGGAITDAEQFYGEMGQRSGVPEEVLTAGTVLAQQVPLALAARGAGNRLALAAQEASMAARAARAAGDLARATQLEQQAATLVAQARRAAMTTGSAVEGGMMAGATEAQAEAAGDPNAKVAGLLSGLGGAALARISPDELALIKLRSADELNTYARRGITPGQRLESAARMVPLTAAEEFAQAQASAALAGAAGATRTQAEQELSAPEEALYGGLVGGVAGSMQAGVEPVGRASVRAAGAPPAAPPAPAPAPPAPAPPVPAGLPPVPAPGTLTPPVTPAPAGPVPLPPPPPAGGWAGPPSAVPPPPSPAAPAPAGLPPPPTPAMTIQGPDGQPMLLPPGVTPADYEAEQARAAEEQARAAEEQAAVQREAEAEQQRRQREMDIELERQRLRAADERTQIAEAERALQEKQAAERARAEAAQQAEAARVAKETAKQAAAAAKLDATRQREADRAAKEAIREQQKATKAAERAAAAQAREVERAAAAQAREQVRKAREAELAERAAALEAERAAARQAAADRQAQREADKAARAAQPKPAPAPAAPTAPAPAAPTAPAPTAPTAPAPTAPTTAAAVAAQEASEETAPTGEAEPEMTQEAAADIMGGTARPGVNPALPQKDDPRVRSQVFRAKARLTNPGYAHAPRWNQKQQQRPFTRAETEVAKRLTNIVRAFGRPPLLPTQFAFDGKKLELPPPHPFLTYQDVMSRLPDAAQRELVRLRSQGLSATAALEQLGWTKDHNAVSRVGQAVDAFTKGSREWAIPTQMDEATFAQFEDIAKRFPPKRPNRAATALAAPATPQPSMPAAESIKRMTPEERQREIDEGYVTPVTPKPPEPKAELPPPPIPADEQPIPPPAKPKPAWPTGEVSPEAKQKLLVALGDMGDTDREFASRARRRASELIDAFYGFTPEEVELDQFAQAETIEDLDQIAARINVDIAQAAAIAEKLPPKPPAPAAPTFAQKHALALHASTPLRSPHAKGTAPDRFRVSEANRDYWRGRARGKTGNTFDAAMAEAMTEALKLEMTGDIRDHIRGPSLMALEPTRLTVEDLEALPEADAASLDPVDQQMQQTARDAGVDLRLVADAPPAFYGAHTTRDGKHRVYVSAKAEPGFMARVLGHELTHAGMRELPPAERAAVLNTLRRLIPPAQFAAMLQDIKARYDTNGWSTEDLLEEVAAQYGEKLYDPEGALFSKLYAEKPGIVDSIISKLLDFVDRLGLRGTDRRATAIVRGVHLRAIRVMQEAHATMVAGPPLAPPLNFMLAPVPPTAPLPPSQRPDLHAKSLTRAANSLIGRWFGKSRLMSKAMRQWYATMNAPRTIARDNLEAGAGEVYNAGRRFQGMTVAMTRRMTEGAKSIFNPASEAAYARATELLHKYDRLGQGIPPSVLAAESSDTQALIKDFQALTTTALRERAAAWHRRLLGNVPPLSSDPLDSAPYEAEIDTWENDVQNAEAALTAATKAHATAPTPTNAAALAVASNDYAVLMTRAPEIKAMRVLTHVQETMGDTAKAGYVPHYWTGSYKAVVAFDPNTGEVLERRMADSEAEEARWSEALTAKHPAAAIRSYPAQSDTWLPPESAKSGSGRSRDRLRRLIQEDPSVAAMIFGRGPDGDQAARDFLAATAPTSRANTEGYELDLQHIAAKLIAGTASFAAGSELDAALRPTLQAWSGRDSLDYQAQRLALDTEVTALEALRRLGLITPVEFQTRTKAVSERLRLLNQLYTARPHLADYFRRWADELKNGREGFLNTFANTANQFGSAVFLGANPTTALLNLTQVTFAGLPLAGGLAGGTGMGEMVRAHQNIYQFGKSVAQDVAKGLARRVTGGPATRSVDMVYRYADSVATADPALAKALREAVDNATVFEVPNDVEFRAALDRPDVAPGELRRRTLEGSPMVWGMFDRAETANRLSTYVAGFRMAEKLKAEGGFWRRARAQGYAGAPGDPAAFAAWFTDEVNFVMGDLDRPFALRGGAKLATSLKSYPIQVWQLTKRMLAAANDLPPGERWRMRAAVAGMVLGNTVAGGAFGGYLPFAVSRALIEAIGKISSGDDEPWDLDMKLYQWLGQDSKVADLATRGVIAAAGVPVGSLPQRVSFYGGLFPDNWSDIGTVAAPFAAGKRVLDQVGKAVSALKSDGRPFEAEQIMDAAMALGGSFAVLGGAAQVWEAKGRERGIRTASGRPVIGPDQLSTSEMVLLGALGIRSEQIVDKRLEDRIITSFESANKGVVKRFKDAYVDALMKAQKGDPAGVRRLAEVRKALLDYNRAHLGKPETLILETFEQTVKRELVGRKLGGTHEFFTEKAALPAVREFRKPNAPAD